MTTKPTTKPRTTKPHVRQASTGRSTKLSLATLPAYCNRSIDSFRPLGEQIANPDGALIYVNNGADVLAVAHLDTVASADRNAIVSRDAHGQYVNAGQLDDRLGVWALLELLPKLTDVPYDILLCDCEEVGNSTAQWFDAAANRYRYMIELDRAGTDCVLYQYAGDAIETRLIDEGWHVGRGAFSDISSLGHLGCVGINFGIGYHDQHTPNCYAYATEIDAQVRRVAQWLDATRDESFPWTEPEYKPIGFSSAYDDVKWCGERSVDTVVCPDCAELLDGYTSLWCHCPYCGGAL